MKAMDNNPNLEYGVFGTSLSLLGTILLWIDNQTIYDAVKMIATIVSIGAGFMTIRYYYHATKKHKEP